VTSGIAFALLPEVGAKEGQEEEKGVLGKITCERRGMPWN
jgi:hypothetical protein